LEQAQAIGKAEIQATGKAAMDSQQKREFAPRGSAVKGAYQFFENVKNEFRKIQWTEGEEVKVYAKVVVFATFVLGLGIYLLDLIIQKALFIVDAFFRLLFG
jgi:preprotein translocase SecE subunit